jgi:Fe-S cluster biogenesis protein NfuA
MCDKCGCGDSLEKPSLADKVGEIIDDIRPNLQSHGGDVELVGVDEDNTVKVRLQGACCGCPGAAMTLKAGIERILKSKIPEVKKVVAVD